MPTSRISTRGLLLYNSEYKLLICRQCRYAIQKSALESHLLRHKIYRGDRQRLLSSIARLTLLDPHRIPLPPPGSPAIGSLPILSGFRCESPACKHLTVSFKRMRRHWSEVHALDGSVPLTPSRTQPVKLQTFFRGTQVRYFEVVPTAALHDNGNTASDEAEDHNEDSEQDSSNDPLIATVVAAPSLTQPRHISNDDEPLDSLEPARFDLETLNCFYHFINKTSTTLPNIRGSSSKHYWQTYVVTRALQRYWLMCGVLAISAQHMAMSTDDAASKRLILEHAKKLTTGFSLGLVQASGRSSSRPRDGETEVEFEKIGEQMKCLLRCTDWVSNETRSESDLGPNAEPTLLNIMSTVRGCITQDVVNLAGSARDYHDGPERQENSYIQSWLQTGSPAHGARQGSSSNINTPNSLLERLEALPNRIAERLGRTDNVQDVLTILSAIKLLVQCCDISFTCEETGAVWHAMTVWLVEISEHFYQMVTRHHPAALVVLAHWGAILVKRAECVECWFLTGFAKHILSQVIKQLTTSCPTVLDLVEWLGDPEQG